MEMDAENPPVGAGADWTIMQGWDAYSEDDHAMWDRLFERQAAMLEGRVVPEFLQGLGILRMDRPGIPEFGALNERLRAATGWEVVAVPGLVPDRVRVRLLPVIGDREIQIEDAASGASE